MLDFATKVRLVRTLLNWRQQGLADALGVSVDTISAWETGLREPLSKTQRLLTILGERNGLEFDLKGYPQYAERKSSESPLSQ